MSPEQASGRPIDFRSDQFSLGSVLYEMAIGRPAFRRGTLVETLTAIIRDEPDGIASLNSRLPAPLCWIIQRCLAKEPAERYASTHDLARDLAEVRDRFLEAPREKTETRPASLPAQRTGFVGRVTERAAVKELLLRQDAYVVTLTGPGGIGKTRLALEVAGEIADELPGGVHFVPLASLNDPELIAATICQVLGVRENAGQPAMATLKEYLHDAVRSPTLLILDSFEHLISAASVVADLVAAGSKLKILVTSRSPLRIYGEQEFPFPRSPWNGRRTPRIFCTATRSPCSRSGPHPWRRTSRSPRRTRPRSRRSAPAWTASLWRSSSPRPASSCSPRRRCSRGWKSACSS